MASSATAVANRFIELAGQSGKTLTPLQLIKLTYLAYAWYLQSSNARLFDEQPQAWQYGPVVPSVYHKAKAYRDHAITAPLTIDWFGSNSVSPEEDRMIGSVFSTYGHFSGIQLSSMTHQPGAPWFQIWHTAGKNAPIPDGLIKNHYDEIRRTRTAG